MICLRKIYQEKIKKNTYHYYIAEKKINSKHVNVGVLLTVFDKGLVSQEQDETYYETDLGMYFKGKGGFNQNIEKITKEEFQREYDIYKQCLRMYAQEKLVKYYSLNAG